MIAPTDDESDHPDYYHAVYFNMFYQGISNLLPWNVLIFAHDYFKERLREVPEASNFLLHFVLIFMIMKFVFLVSGIRVTSRISTDQQITWSIGANAAVFVSLAVISAVRFLPAMVHYYLLLLLVLLAALFSAFTEAGFLAVLAHFPARYTQSYLVGHGFAGVVTALLHMSTAVGTASAVSRTFAELYFGFAAFVVLSSLLLFQYMQGLNMFQFHYQKGRSLIRAKQEADHLEKETGMRSGKNSSTMQVFKEISDLFFTVFLITWLNVLVSPMVIFMTEPSQDGLAELSGTSRSFYYVFALLLGSIFDLIGRCFPAVSSLVTIKMPFLLVASIRLIFLPLLLLGNLKIEGYKLPFAPLYTNDYIFFTLIALKAFSGGYFGTLCMMWSPMRVRQLDRSRAVTLMVYALGFGLLIGAISAYALKQVLIVISTPA